MPRKTKQSAHAALDELRQHAAGERVKARELEAELEAAKIEVETASAAISEAYAAEDQHAAAAARKTEAAAVATVRDLQHRLDGARIRVERAQADADAFQMEHAAELLEEREAEARELAVKLTGAGHEAVRLHRAYRAMRTESTRWSPPCRAQRHGPMGPPPHTRGRTTCAPWSAPSRNTRRSRPRCRGGSVSRTASCRTTPTASSASSAAARRPPPRSPRRASG